MGFDFNPTVKKDDKGVGKIHLGGAEEEQKKADDAAAAKKKKWLIGGGIGVGVAVIGLAGVFGLASHKHETPAPQPTRQAEPARQPSQYTPPPVQYPTAQAPTAATITAQSVQAKESAIYRDDASVFRDQSGQRAEAYIGFAGQEVQQGQDFAVHVSLFNRGGVSVFVASGPYAGSRVEFMPVDASGGSRITYTKVGQEVTGADGRTTQFQAFPSSSRATQTVSMRTPRVQGSGVTLPTGAAEFEKMVTSNGKYVKAFSLRGSPAEDGVFSIRIWNGDTYNFNLKTGEYAIDSVFLYHPNYQQEYRQTGVSVDRNTLPVVKGVVQVAPAHTPNAAPAPGR